MGELYEALREFNDETGTKHLERSSNLKVGNQPGRRVLRSMNQYESRNARVKKLHQGEASLTDLSVLPHASQRLDADSEAVASREKSAVHR